MSHQHVNSIHAALAAELEHARTQIDRLRQAQQTLIQQLLDQGVSEVDALGNVTQWKSYKALRRDENLYLSMWLRLSKRLEKFMETPETGGIDNVAPMPSPPTRDAAPRNAPCPCGSGLKYKRCCLGKPLGQKAA